MNYTALYYLMNERRTLIEIKVEDIPSGATKEERYQWLSICTETKNIEKLVFRSMGEEMVNGNLMSIRSFENAELRFDKSFGKFVIAAEGYILMNCTEQSVPEDLDRLIKDFLSQ